ncbi:MAG: helix-turn-helix transcriptional regulator [Bryobacteraceae bacterium]
MTLILSSATEFLLDFYAPWFREIERRFQIPASSLAGQSRLRLIGRTEHWKAEAFQHGLDGEKLGSIETEGASAVEPRGDESASPKEKAPTRLGGGKPKAKSGGRPSGTTVDSVRLRTYRAQYSQEDFADKCGVSLGTIQRGEAGRRWDEKTFVTVAKNITALGNKRVSPEDLKNRRN